MKFLEEGILHTDFFFQFLLDIGKELTIKIDFAVNVLVFIFEVKFLQKENSEEDLLA